MRKIFLLLVIFLLTQALTAQFNDVKSGTSTIDTTFIAAEMELMSLGKTVLQDSLLVNRQNANHQLGILLEETLSRENAYSYPFDSLLSISMLRSNDDSFRVFTWQLFEKDDTYSYMGYILKSDGTLIKLNDTSSDYFTPEFETGDKDHWYGALYYNMIPFQSNNQHMYLLFGFDGNKLYEKRKLIDVLSFDEEGKPVFGASVFVPGEGSTSHPESLSRVVLEYFAGASFKCNYDELQNQILYEHLIFKSTEVGQFLIPDGTYEGYVLEEGKWKHNVKVFHTTLDEPPFPAPKNEHKDIFGNTNDRSSVNPSRSKKRYEEVRKRNEKRRKEKQKAKFESENN